ncbi:MAG: F0F1 ATP synthase subunit A [Actinomycetes bacterium]
MKLKRLIIAVTGFALVVPAQALAADFDPSQEFELKSWVSIHLGPLDMSINKAVVYLMLAAALTCALGIFTMRFQFAGNKVGRRQTFGEVVYDIAQNQIAESNLPHKAMKMWFPYVATLMIFIWVINLLGFLPLPLSGETYHGIPVWGIYAATSSLSVTLALSLMTWVFTHIEGIRYNGPIKYFKSWIPDVPKVLLPLIVPIEILSQFMRLISLSVRLYANMLAGHILILTFIGLIFIFETFFAVPLVGVSAIFYTFEVVIVVTIQAFIFAILSAIYIGSAIEPEH